MGVLGDIKVLTQKNPFAGSDALLAIEKFNISDLPLDDFERSIENYIPPRPNLSIVSEKYNAEVAQLPLKTDQLLTFLQSESVSLLDAQFTKTIADIQNAINQLSKLEVPHVSGLFSGGGSGIMASLPSGKTLLAFLKSLKTALENFSREFLLKDFLDLFGKLVAGLKDMGNNALGISFSAPELSDSLSKTLDLVAKTLSTVSLESVTKHIKELNRQYNFAETVELLNKLQVRLVSETSFHSAEPISDMLDEVEATLDQWLDKLENGSMEQMLMGMESINKCISGPLKSALPTLDTLGWNIGKVDRNSLSQLLDHDPFQLEVNQLKATFEKSLDQFDQLGLASIQTKLTSLNSSLTNILDTASGIIQDAGGVLSSATNVLVSDLKEIQKEVLELLQKVKEDLIVGFDGFLQPIEKPFNEGIDLASGVLQKLDIQRLREQLVAYLNVFRETLDNETILQSIDKFDGMIRAMRRIRFSTATGTVIDALKVITKTLQVMKMVPLTKSVTKEIEKLTSGLPEDLSPLTSKIEDEIEDLIKEIEEWKVFVQISETADQILAEIEGLDLQELIDQHALEPFKSFHGTVSKLEISQLTDPIEEEFADISDKLREVLDTTHIRNELDEVFKDVIDLLGQIKVTDIAEELTSVINDSLQSITTTLPASDFIESVEKTVSTVESEVKGLEGMVHAGFESIYSSFNELEQSEQGVNAFLDEIVDETNKINETLPLGQWLAELKPILSDIIEVFKIPVKELNDQIRENPIQGKIKELSSLLDQYQGKQQVDNTLSQRLYQVNDKLTSFGVQLTHLQASLDLIDHMTSQWLQQGDSIDLTLLDSFLKNADWKYFKPLLTFFFESARQLKALIQEIEAVLLGSIVPFKDILQDIRSISISLDDTHQILSNLTLVDEQVVNEEVTKVVAGFKTVVDQLNPSALLKSVDNAIDELIQSLTPSELLSIADIEKKYQELLKGIEEKDPGNWINDAVRFEFDAVKDLLKKYDVSKLIKQLMETLNSLEDQLSTELSKTTKAYGEMQAVLRSEPVKIPIKLPSIKPPKLKTPEVKIKKPKVKF